MVQLDRRIFKSIISQTSSSAVPRAVAIMASHGSSSDNHIDEPKQSRDFPPPGTDEENVSVKGDGEKSEPSQAPNEKISTASDKDQYLVDWEKDDEADPRNWSVPFKWWCTVQLALCALAGSMGSSIISPGEGSIEKYTGVTAEAAVLCVSLYM